MQSAVDLTSTHPSIDVETRGCALLLVAAIVQATKDLCEPPNSEEQMAQRNFQSDARASLEFFFGLDQEVFRLYCQFVGIDANLYLNKLRHGEPMDVKNPPYTERDYRIFRTRIKWWDKERKQFQREAV